MRPLSLPLALVVALSYLAYASTAAFTPASLGLLAAAVVAVALRGKVPIPRMVLIPVALVLGLVIFSNLPAQARGATFLLATGYGVGLFLALLTLLMLLRAGSDGENQTTVFMGLMLMLIAGSTTALFPFAPVLAVQGLLLGIGLRGFGPPDGRTRVPRGEGTAPPRVAPGLLWSMAAYLVVVCGAALIALTLASSERFFNHLLLLADTSGYSYPQRSSLREILDVRDNPRILARVFSANPAMYLVGRCYVKYERSAWDATVPQAEVPQLQDHPSLSGLFDGPLFPLAGAVPTDFTPTMVDRVEAAVEFHGSLFTPRDGVVLGARLKTLSRDAADVFYMPDGVNYSGDYVVARAKRPPDATPLQAEARDACLQVPASVSDFIDPLVRRAVDGAHTDLQAAQNVEHFLQTSYTYGRGYHLPPGEPLQGFLMQRIPAHCELFATSMVMMLRRHGIPSRYVTGFLVQERNEAGDYFVVREEEAHAWVEAWIAGLGWVQFDPTPTDGRPQPPRISRTSQWIDVLTHKFQQWRDRLRGLSWRAALGALLGGAQRLGTWLIEKWWRIGLLLTLFFAEALFRRPDAPGRRWWRQWRSGRAGTGGLQDPLMEALFASMSRFDALMARAGHARPPFRTLREHARALAEVGELDPALRDLAVEFLETYGRTRYGQPRPQEAEVRALGDMCDRMESLAPPPGRR